MEFRKTLFFEIPNKDFIMPIYKEQDVNILKSFLQDDIVQFSIGYKSLEDEEGYYYIGQVKEFTSTFRLGDFPVVYRKRILDILEGLEKNPKYVDFDEEQRNVSKIVYFQMTKNGPLAFLIDNTEQNLDKLERLGIKDYYIKEIPALVISNYGNRDVYIKDEVFYQIKNPNY